MDEKLALAYALFTILLVPLLGTTLLFVTARVRRVRRSRSHGIVRSSLLLLGGAMLLLGGVGIPAILVASGFGNAGGGPTFLSLLSDSLMIFLTGFVGWVGVLVLRLARALRQAESPTEQADLAERLSLVQVFSWCFVGLPLLFVAPLLVPLCIIPFVLIEGPASLRRARQGHLLWVLAIAVRRNQPLPALLDSYAETIGDSAIALPGPLLRFVGSLRSTVAFWRKKFREQVRGLADRLRDGFTLPEALEELPGLLPRSVVVAARVGHETGCLDSALDDAARRQSRLFHQSGTAADISSFFLYTAAVVSVTLVVFFFQVVFIVPKLKRIFEVFEIDLPPLTQHLLFTTDVLMGHLLLVAPIVSLPCLLLLVFGISWFWGWDNIRAPWLTRWWPRLHTPGVLRNLSLSLAAEHRLVSCLDAQIAAVHRPEVAMRLERVRDAVEAGDSGWAALGQERMINLREVQLLESAQRLGNLPWALDMLSQAADRRLYRRVIWIFHVTRPILIGALALVVGVICVAFFLPLVETLHKQAP